MDVNGTRFHLLQGATDWSRCTPASADSAVAFGDTVSLAPRLFQFPVAATPNGDAASLRRGAARDRYGNWYWIDADGTRVLVRSSGDNALGVFWRAPAAARYTTTPARGAFGPVEPPPEPAPCRFAGLAVTEDHYLLVGTLDQPGLLVFDLHAGGPPRHLRWPASRPFVAFDMAARPGGGVFILDRENRAYWALDRQLGVLDPDAGAPPAPATFVAADGTNPAPAPALGWPAGMGVSASSPVAAADPIAIEALPDGTVLILDRQPVPTVHRYRLAQRLGSVALDLTPVLDPAGTSVPPLGADLAYVAGATEDADRVYLPAADGAQCFAFTIGWQDTALAIAAAADAPFLPMRLYGGKGVVAGGGDAYYDFGAAGSGSEAWLPLVAQRRSRFEAAGAFDTPPFDGLEPGCVWHRLIFDGCVPPGAQVAIQSRTADELENLPSALWAPEPAPRRRGTGRELAFSAPIPAPAVPPGSDTGSFELLFQRARGRWLQLRITLSGDGRTSPRLRALRVWYPRFSYLAQYLPATYRDDPESASFLDRFLANLEGVFTDVEDRMAAARALFDARTAPAEALDWLAAWFGVALDPAWDEMRRRLFLRHAMDFFRMRGTVRGLQTALRLVIDDCVDDDLFAADTGDTPASIRIVEWFRLRSLPPLALGDPAPAAGIRQISSPASGTTDRRWLPAQGRATLLSRWSDALAAAGLPDGELSLTAPADAATAATWQAFVGDALGFTPGTGARAQQAFRDFLARRYRRISIYDTTYGAAAASFDELALPASLPADGAPLRDWYDFNAIALATRATGHRFTVLLPVPAREAFALEQHEQRRALAERIIDLEKPAHTLYDVKFYWAMFRVGEARLAIDTLLDQSSRAPELMPPVVLGQAFLSEGRLAATPAEREQERPILGTFPLRTRQNPEEMRS